MIVYIDVDGTCGDLMTQWLGKYNGDFDDNLTPEKLTGWNLEEVVDPKCGKHIYEYIENPNIYNNVEPIDGALDGVNYIRSLGHRVVFATSTTNGCAGRKLNWLIDNGFLNKDDLKGTTHPDYIEIHDKGLLFGDILIDDGPHNVEKFNGYAILFKQPHNKDFVWPVKSDWAHIREYIHNGTIPPGTHPTELKSPNQAREFKDIIKKMYEVHLAKNFDYSPSNILVTGQIGLITRLWDKIARFCNLTGYTVSMKDEKDIGATMFYTMSRILAFGGFLNKLTLTFTGVKKEPKNESIDDSLYDMAVYAIIGLLLRKGKWGR